MNIENILTVALSELMLSLDINGWCVQIENDQFVFIMRDKDLFIVSYDTYRNEIEKYLGKFEFRHGTMLRHNLLQ